VSARHLMARISHRIDYNGAGGCWIFSGTITPNGYGQVYHNGNTHALAHRVVFEAVVGPIPEGLVIDHICRVRHCVNPEHLEPVTQRENLLRGQGAAAKNAARTHCQRGHEFTPENTFTYSTQPAYLRGCRTCRRDNDRARWRSRRDMTPEELAVRHGYDRRAKERKQARAQALRDEANA
jgi:hypothetical protein